MGKRKVSPDVIEKINEDDASYSQHLNFVGLNRRTSPPEETLFTMYRDILLSFTKNGDFKREKETGMVYKPVRPYIYARYKSPHDFEVFDVVVQSPSLAQLRTLKHLEKYMKQYDHFDFPFLQPQ